MRYSLDMDGLAVSFVHKRIFGGVKGFIGGGPGGAIGGFLGGGGGGGGMPNTGSRIMMRNVATGQVLLGRRGGLPPKAGRDQDWVPVGQQPQVLPKSIAAGGPCPGIGKVRGPGGTCIDLFALPPGGDPAITAQVGAAVMGRYGAALAPGSRIIDRAVCLRGMVLGNDGLCYNRTQVKNSERMWPRGRRPLLTGGDMRAISTAARAAGRLERTTKRLQKIGLMKKAAPRRMKAITSGSGDHHHLHHG